MGNTYYIYYIYEYIIYIKENKKYVIIFML